MERRQFLPTLASPLLATSAYSQARPRPNFVFVLVDDLRWDSLGCTGHPFLKTPHIDSLAAEGARFTNAFVTTPLCSPARGSFLTGQYVHKHGVVGNRGHEELSHKLVTFPRILRDAGYETGYVGKWHMGNDDTPRPGFDRWVSFRGQGVYNDPALNIDGKAVKESGYITDILSKHAAEFIGGRREKPFCLYLGHKAIHGPFTPAERHRDLYRDEPLPRRPNYKPGGPSDDIARNQMRCIASIDDGVGTLIGALKQSGQYDNTCFVFTSDNGYFWGEHGYGDKRWAFDESLRIPLVARMPSRIAAGSVIAGDALNIDIAPTFLDLAGVKPPSWMHGQSLAPLWAKRPPKWREGFLAEYMKEANFPRTPTWQAYRTPKWKYVRYPEETREELFDLAADPYEMTNRIADRGASRQLARMRTDLDRLLRATS
ncbi:MAG: sulfatase [Bryobacteraceae bacterium]